MSMQYGRSPVFEGTTVVAPFIDGFFLTQVVLYFAYLDIQHDTSVCICA